MSEFEVLEHVTHDKEQEIIIQKLLTNTTTAVNCIANTGLSYQVPRKKHLSKAQHEDNIQ